jgi:hypothetical protein
MGYESVTKNVLLLIESLLQNAKQLQHTRFSWRVNCPKVGTSFANKRRPLGRYSSLADYNPHSLVLFFFFSKLSNRYSVSLQVYSSICGVTASNAATIRSFSLSRKVTGSYKHVLNITPQEEIKRRTIGSPWRPWNWSITPNPAPMSRNSRTIRVRTLQSYTHNIPPLFTFIPIYSMTSGAFFRWYRLAESELSDERTALIFSFLE